MGEGEERQIDQKKNFFFLQLLLSIFILNESLVKLQRGIEPNFPSLGDMLSFFFYIGKFETLHKLFDSFFFFSHQN